MSTGAAMALKAMHSAAVRGMQQNEGRRGNRALWESYRKIKQHLESRCPALSGES